MGLHKQKWFTNVAAAVVERALLVIRTPSGFGEAR
jgi:hypothetical protein